MRIQISFLIIFLANSFSSFSQQAAFDENGRAHEILLDEQIKTVQFYRKGWINSYPILTLNETTPLVLEFDDLSDAMGNYSYLIIHCNADWTESELMNQEYMDGYFENPIRNMEASFNTYYHYYHYSLSIPNEDISLSKSGNYLLVVFRNNNREEILFTRRFMVSEAAVNISANVKRPVLSMYRDAGHEVDVTVEHAYYRIDDPYNETTLSIFQNGVWDHEISDLKPLFINPGKLIYDYQQENVFKAGNEFRSFNTTNTQVREYHIKNIDYFEYFHFELKTDEANPAHLYFDRDDMNGKFFIEAEDVRDEKVEADYGFVHFTLRMPLKIQGGSVFIAGGLTNWQFTHQNMMKYDAAKQEYRGTLLLKQGIYNYRYIFLPDNAGSFDIAEIEGSHFQTKNEYLILFYHRGQGDRFDRLVGHQVVRSEAG
ncbi:MAG TPA: DUF5103 domain-containing protein [Bacteroidales bacterium]|nr:DUF5103 domain-containing protein [Bacteroidales bacterium]